MTNDPERWEALARYLTGESTPEEAAAMRAWLAEDPSREKAAEALGRAMGQAAFTPAADLDVEAALTNVKQRRDESDVLPLSRPAAQELPARGWTTTVIRIAAAVVLLLGAGLLWQATQTGPDSPSAPQTFATAVGQTDSVTLSDGTRVILAPASRLTIAIDYNEKDRLVRLDGEALFDVPHDDSKPFTVLAGLATIKDLGTTFTVRNDDAQRVRVAVTSGSVLLRAVSAAPDTGVVLHAGERGMVSAAGTTTVLQGAIPEADLAWTRGTLVFDNASLSQVKLELKRWYGVELQFGDSAIARRTITATFDREPIDRVLNVIALALALEVERSGDTAVIRR